MIELNNGYQCPQLGIGTFLLTPEEAENSVKVALETGYRLVDTAAMYVNERACGRAITASGLPREDIVISTKLWPTDYENPNAVSETLERLGVDYVDVLYIHQPAGNWKAGYRQIEKAYKDGKAKAIGISNFENGFFDELSALWEVAPQFIQVEAHPYFPQTDLRAQLAEHDIALMSWFPLGHGDSALLNEPVFVQLAEKYGKTPAQIILRWHVDMGFVVIPGSKNIEHIKSNFEIFDFTLSDDDMQAIAGLNKGTRYYTQTQERLEHYASAPPEYEQA